MEADTRRPSAGPAPMFGWPRIALDRTVHAEARCSVDFNLPKEHEPGAGHDPSCSSFSDFALYRASLSLPWRRNAGRLTVLTADTSPANFAYINACYGPAPNVRHVSRQALWRALEARFRSHLLDSAVRELARRYPEFSAQRVVTGGQTRILIALPALLALAFYAMPATANAALLCLLTLAYIANAVFRIVLVWLGAAPNGPPASPLRRADRDLPLYSIIVPLHREAQMIPALVDALTALDYPADRLEIALVLEADDTETIAAVRVQPLDDRFLVLEVPRGGPRTKPKAANYALSFLNGAFTVIYDAEDRPEPDQLRKALAAFRAAPKNVVCLQARLNFYNARENWLTRGIMAQTPLA